MFLTVLVVAGSNISPMMPSIHFGGIQRNESSIRPSILNFTYKDGQSSHMRSMEAYRSIPILLQGHFC